MICDTLLLSALVSWILFSASSYFRKVCRSRIVRSLNDIFGTFAQCKCFSLKPPGSATHNLIADCTHQNQTRKPHESFVNARAMMKAHGDGMTTDPNLFPPTPRKFWQILIVVSLKFSHISLWWLNEMRKANKYSGAGHEIEWLYPTWNKAMYRLIRKYA